VSDLILDEEDSPADENDKSCSDGSDCSGESVQRRLFSFYLVTSDASSGQDIVKIHNDGNPLPFPSKLLRYSTTISISSLHDAELFLITNSFLACQDIP
jgi:hypothetical protein